MQKKKKKQRIHQKLKRHKMEMQLKHGEENPENKEEDATKIESRIQQ